MELMCEYPNCDVRKTRVDMSQCIDLMKMHILGVHTTMTTTEGVNEEERERMMKWNLTARPILSDSEWVGLFAEAGYKGDYYWFVP